MTVYESVSNWLSEILQNPANGFPADIYGAIDPEIIPKYRLEFPDWNMLDTGIFSNPNDIHSQLNGGQIKHIEVKSWYINRKFLSREDRVGNEEFKEKLRKAITRKALGSVYPQDGRKWRKIEVEGGIYPYQKSDNLSEAIYLVNLRIEYIE
jgi:hypothetical protein